MRPSVEAITSWGSGPEGRPPEHLQRRGIDDGQGEVGLRKNEERAVGRRDLREQHGWTSRV